MGELIRELNFGAWALRLEETVLGRAVSVVRYDGVNDRWEYRSTTWFGDDHEEAADFVDKMRVGLSLDALRRRHPDEVLEDLA